MQKVLEILVCFIAGMGAGLGTGFAGLSAAAVISPMLITFLDIPAYEAIGIALASDVLASAVSRSKVLTGILLIQAFLSLIAYMTHLLLNG